jgi:hypothetical protein
LDRESLERWEKKTSLWNEGYLSDLKARLLRDPASLNPETRSYLEAGRTSVAFLNGFHEDFVVQVSAVVGGDTTKRTRPRLISSMPETAAGAHWWIHRMERPSRLHYL